MPPAADRPPFDTVAIAGLGLIGGSIALGLRERWPECRVVGVDTRSVLAHALGSGAVDRTADRLADVGPVDLVVLAAPVHQNVALLAEAARLLPPDAIVTDVGGTKRDIVRAARARPGPTFVGGHPIGGAERGGFGFARADLFAGRPWIFTPETTTPAPALARLFAFVEGLGARPATLDAEHHDRLMARLSHLPQLAASALMAVIGASVAPGELRMAGRGLIDTTRLASSPSGAWRDICSANAEAIGEALDALIARLSTLRGELARPEAIDALFEEAARHRADLMKGDG